MSQIFAIVLLIVNRIFRHREPVVPEILTEILTEENKDKEEEEEQDKEDKEPVINDL